MGKADFAWADKLRRLYYPPEKNIVSAHITLFHHLPPQALPEIKRSLIELTQSCGKPKARLSQLISLGRGVAYQVECPELLDMRMELADRFHGLLVAQDQQVPRLHVTVQNKVSSQRARETLQILASEFEPRPFDISGLGLQYYVEGPWQPIGTWPFRG